MKPFRCSGVQTSATAARARLSKYSQPHSTRTATAQRPRKAHGPVPCLTGFERVARPAVHATAASPACRTRRTPYTVAENRHFCDNFGLCASQRLLQQLRSHSPVRGLHRARLRHRDRSLSASPCLPARNTRKVPQRAADNFGRRHCVEHVAFHSVRQFRRYLSASQH